MTRQMKGMHVMRCNRQQNPIANENDNFGKYGGPQMGVAEWRTRVNKNESFPGNQHKASLRTDCRLFQLLCAPNFVMLWACFHAERYLTNHSRLAFCDARTCSFDNDGDHGKMGMDSLFVSYFFSAIVNLCIGHEPAQLFCFVASQAKRIWTKVPWCDHPARGLRHDAKTGYENN